MNALKSMAAVFLILVMSWFIVLLLWFITIVIPAKIYANNRCLEMGYLHAAQVSDTLKFYCYSLPDDPTELIDLP